METFRCQNLSNFTESLMRKSQVETTGADACVFCVRARDTAGWGNRCMAGSCGGGGGGRSSRGSVQYVISDG